HSERKIEHSLRGEIEFRSQNADDGVAASVQADRLPENVWVRGETALPQSVAQDHLVIAAGLIFFGEESAAHHGACSEHVKEIRSDHFAANFFRVTFAGKVEFGAVHRTHRAIG